MTSALAYVWFGFCKTNREITCSAARTKELWQTKGQLCARNKQPAHISCDHVCGLCFAILSCVFLLQAQLEENNLFLLSVCVFYFCLLIELKSTGTAHHFSFLLNSTDYRILRMDEDHDRMYVGSKDYILSLDLHDINKEPLIVRNVPHQQ